MLYLSCCFQVAFLAVLLTFFSNTQEVNPGEQGLPLKVEADIPFKGVEIVNDNTYLISDGIDPLEIELGRMQTGLEHFVKVHFKNMLDSRLRLLTLNLVADVLRPRNERRMYHRRRTAIFISRSSRNLKNRRFRSL